MERASSFCYFGVTLDKHLLWNEHVEIICHKVSKRLGLLSRVWSYLTQKAAKCVCNCLVQPRYGVGCQLVTVKTFSVYRTGQHTTEEAFQKLGWISLETQRIMHKNILVYKCLNNLAPPYFCDYFIRNNCIHSYNTDLQSRFFLINYLERWKELHHSLILKIFLNNTRWDIVYFISFFILHDCYLLASGSSLLLFIM